MSGQPLPGAATSIAEASSYSTDSYMGCLDARIASGLGVASQQATSGCEETVRYALIWCPEVPDGTRFALVRRDENGAGERLEAGVLNERAPSLNLARLRQRGAQLGANEVVLILP